MLALSDKQHAIHVQQTQTTICETTLTSPSVFFFEESMLPTRLVGRRYCSCSSLELSERVPAAEEWPKEDRPTTIFKLALAAAAAEVAKLRGGAGERSGDVGARFVVVNIGAWSMRTYEVEVIRAARKATSVTTAIDGDGIVRVLLLLLVVVASWAWLVDEPMRPGDPLPPPRIWDRC